MSRAEDTGEVKLPDLPENVPLDPDLTAVKELSTAEDVPAVPYAPANVTPWQEGSGTADPSTAAPGTTVPVSGGLPVFLGVPAGTDPAALAGEWKVDLAAPATSQEAGVSGLIMQITPPATVDPTAEVTLDVDPHNFKDLYGPVAGERLGFVRLPDCVFSSPTAGECADSAGTETMSGKGDVDSFERLPSSVKVVPAKSSRGKTNAAQARTIVTGTLSVGKLLDGDDAPIATGASVEPAALSGATAPGSFTVGVLDTGASSSGDFTASPLLSSGSWSSGSSSGAFTYGYQVQIPEVAGGLMPKVNLAYSSQSVDGRTSATNNQASWIGDGWDYNAGSITRTYANCRQDAKKPGSNNPAHGTGDLCYGSENATLSLGGSTTELVWDVTKGPNGSDGKPVGAWFTANGDGSKIERIKDTSKDPRSGMKDEDGEYWVVTTKDGTKYYFGLNKLPGWSEGDAYTNSVLAVPVYGNHAGEPCYKAGDWAGSHCDQAWRWNLDYVENIHGNAMSLWWNRDVNYYARNFNWSVPVEYHRDGYLSRIDYGQRKDTLFSATAPASVKFDVAERCYTVDSITCTEANFTSKDPGNYRPWYDTPADLRCAAGKMCWNAGPTFWSRKRLDKITTSSQRLTSTTARQAVDEYQLTQRLPVTKTGVNTALWLESIERRGYGRNGATDASVKLNAVRFEHNREDMPNRVKDDDRPGFSRLRIARVINEYGGETVVTYKQPVDECATGAGLPGKTDTTGLKSNTRFCYPSFWHPDAAIEDIDWFHKYVVETVEELPNVPGSYSTLTSYEYKNPGWKLAEAEFTKKSTRTYSQFAGFEQTTTFTGTDQPDIGSKRSKSVTRFFRGMGSTELVLDIEERQIAKDEEPFAGRIAEQLTYTNAGDADTDWLTRSVTVPYATELARRNRDDGLTPLRSWRVTEPKTISYTKSSGTGDDKRLERRIETLTQYNADGLPTQVEFLGDTEKTGDESCTQSKYLDRPDKNLIGLTKEVLTSPTTCVNAKFGDLTTLSGGTRTAYDNQVYEVETLSATTRGLATETWSLNGEGTAFQSDGTTGFDAVGRVIRRTDPDQKSSTITYEPSAGQVFKVTERNSLGHEQIQELEPGRSVGLKTTDANGRVNQAEYDPLGRLRKAWGAGRTPSPTAVPDFEAVYTIPEIRLDDATRTPPYVTTHARGDEGRIDTSVTIYDGLGRERQTQEEATGRGWLITDTLYNRSSEIWRTQNAYLTYEAQPGQLFTPEADTAVPNATQYTYDGLGRVVEEMPYLKFETPGSEGATSQAFPERATRYEYGQDWSTVVNPQGAVSYRIYNDALGRTSRVDTFTDAARQKFTSMAYEYDTRGQLAKASSSADPAHPWSWTYDHRGRMDSSTDPDAGTTETEYDHRDRPKSVTNDRRVTVGYAYDELSRPTQQKLGDGTLLADFTYDTVPGGKGLPAAVTRYTDGLAYKQQVNGYDKDYQPTSATLSLPQSIADTWGLQSSYTYGYQYSDTGRLDAATLPAVGALAAEKLVVRYNKDGLPLSISGKDWYGAETVYSPYGQVMRSTLGAQPYRVWTQNTFDEASGELKDQQVYREQTGDTSVVGGVLVSKRSYNYDPAGNVTGIQEHSLGIEERQCFAYDPLGQLKKAWTDKNLAACAADTTNIDGTLNVAAGKDGSGYWQEYEYDLLGNRTKLTEKDLTGDASKNAITDYTYGKADGSQPHTLTKVSKAYKTPAGAAVKAEAERLYELTGETKSVTSLQNGDSQALSWTYDGQIDRITGQGTGGKTPYVGPGNKCLDVKSGVAVPGQVIQLWDCNASATQNFRFTPTPGQTDPNLGTLASHDTWCLQPAANTVGSAVQSQKCNGTAAQQLKRNTVGQFTHVASGLCVAVKDAATASGTPTVLATCDGAAAAQQWAPQNDTRHIYGPDGGRLLTIKGRQATLHLGEAEVTVQKNGTVATLINTQRTYSAPGGAVMRVAYGTGASSLVAITMDHQGSPYAEVALSGGQTIRIRKQDPFGNQRGAATSGAGLQTHKGFLGATNDDASGYTPLGARLYDPVVGRFLSADPIVDLTDPQQSNGYAYAHNNPVTHSDPSGLAISLTASERAAALAGAGLSAAEVAQAQSMMGKSLSSVILSIAWETLKDFIGINDAMACFGGDMWSCGSLIIEAIPWGKIGKIPSVLRAIDRTIGAIQAFKAAKKAAEIVLKAAKAAEAAALKAKMAAIEKAKKAAQAAKKKAAEQAKKKISDQAVQKTKKTGNPIQKQAQAKAAPKSSSAAGSGKGGGGGGGKVSTTKVGGGAKGGGSSGGSSRGNGGSSGGSCSTPDNSFVPGAKVLMADGSAKPIEQVRTGDKVVATDPRTGETRVETVTAEIKGQGVKHLVKVTIDTDGKTGSKTAQVTATDGHPFWAPELSRWIDATDLTSGQWLQTGTGTYVQIASIERWTAQAATVHNLTVSDLHTYYVLAGATPVLVHNCNGRDPVNGGLDDDTYDRIDSAHGPDVADGVDYQVQRMHDGSSTAADHDLPGIGHDPDALGSYFASWRGKMTHTDTRTGSRVAYDSSRGVLIVTTGRNIHGFRYGQGAFESGRYVTP
ncbi:ricin-type beta-trefoil lectin domain protein [Streptomyces sp. SR27]|uniref:ricin-type beta-trefoil lectin domain protein n=1 Tax=Streptomyces sp. SR27 TaxID=3076630 RepID=UPI00295A7759|nr:ricin-type beta-trefoil lectin domain protein [Streptomyces sp. SR27]MDV9187496.1 ricin-type beta-trefoil lectin domain protein [Streptomyces sp. SR27]